MITKTKTTRQPIPSESAAKPWSTNENSLNIALSTMLATVLFYIVSITQIDMDLWGHLRFGLDILQTGILRPTDQYSFMTDNYQWFDHEWLSQWFMAVAYTAAGWYGLVCLKIVLGSACMWLMFRRIMSSRTDSFGKMLLIFPLAFLFAPAVHVIRPHIFTCLCLCILFWLLRKSADDGRLKLLWLPPLFSVWVNLHGGIVVGLCAIAAWTFAEILRKDRSRVVFLSSMLFASVTAILVNPYGAELFQFLANVAIMPRSENAEWAPIALASPWGAGYLGVLLFSMASLVFSKRNRDIRPIVVWMIFAFAPLIAIRHLPLFVVATAMLIGEHIVDFLEQKRKLQLLQPKEAQFILISSIGVSLMLAVFAVININKLEVAEQISPPSRAAAALKSVHAHGNILCHWEWGEYLIWHFNGDVKVSYDGRCETAYSPLAKLANFCFYDGLASWDIILQRRPVDLILVKKESASFNLMKLRRGWELAYEDNEAAIFCPKGSAYIEKLHQLHDKKELPLL